MPISDTGKLGKTRRPAPKELVLRLVKGKYPGIDIKHKTSKTEEARAVAICLLRHASKMGEVQIENEVHCGKTELQAALDRFAQEEESGKNDFAENTRKLLSMCNPPEVQKDTV